MTAISFPVLTKRPSSWSWKLIGNAQNFTSPLTGSTQTMELPGARWWLKFGYTKLRQDDSRVFDAFLASMRGMAGRVLLNPIHTESRRGIATGIPVVDGAGQTGRTLSTSGWTPSTAGIMRTGDYFSVATASGPELKILTADAASNASEKASLMFEPPLRSTPVNGAAINVSAPVCPMRLVDADQGELALNAPYYLSWTGEFVEAWL